MQAKETKLQDIIEGTKQYVIPLFQRTYSWTDKEWGILWKDIIELCDMENPRTHFIGSIVNMPTVSVPEGVAKYLLIDGQQRLSTIFILLTLLRNKARESQNQDFADEINNTLLVNPYKKDNDFFKLMPTQFDRDTYKNLINGQQTNTDNQIFRAYDFFDKKLRQVQIAYDKLKKVITSYFSVVSIVLDTDDNPYLVFESLNAKGRPLTQADLIRNYFFMRIHIDKQDTVFKDYWQPMQQALTTNLTEYIRHFLMREGSTVKQSDVYYVLKECVSQNNAIDYLKELKKFSVYYQRIVYPELEPILELQRQFRRLNRIEVTTAYPLILNFYGNYDDGKLSMSDFIGILKALENYLLRRFVCRIPTNQLNKIFPSVFTQIKSNYPDKIFEGFKNTLQSKGYPKDDTFFKCFKETNFYGAGDRQVKTKLILETIEESFAHKESVAFDNMTIEHIMPQTLSEWWQKNLGVDWGKTHELLLHTIGNLTLSAYNSELSNDDFDEKKRTYYVSHLEINKYFDNIEVWKHTEIETRSAYLSNKAIEIWPYFGSENSSPSDMKDVSGTTPTNLYILGQKIEVNTWRDVLEQTLNTIADLEPDKFLIIANNFPSYVGADKNRFRAIRQLQNGFFIEVNLSAQTIQKLCYQAMETIELSAEEWYVSII